MKDPWTEYPKTPWPWIAAEFPFVVRWTVPHPDCKWMTITREFTTLEAAVTAYKRPFKGIDVDLVAYNGRKPGDHLDTLARRRATKATKWSNKVPAELRT